MLRKRSIQSVSNCTRKQLIVNPSGVFASSCTSTVDPDEVMPPNSLAVMQALSKEVGRVMIKAKSNLPPFLM